MKFGAESEQFEHRSIPQIRRDLRTEDEIYGPQKFLVRTKLQATRNFIQRWPFQKQNLRSAEGELRFKVWAAQSWFHIVRHPELRLDSF
jgi:hypothetical protein